MESIKELKKLNKYPTFKGFIEKDKLLQNTRKPKTFDEIKEIACQTKVRAEIDYWDGKETKYKTEIIKSGLFDYFKHREDVLKKFSDDFLEKFTDYGDKKPENESIVHNILFQRSNDDIINNSIDVYFNHNLWLIDDKFSLFHNARSTVNGERASDIYLYCDNNKTTEVVIIELKSTHNAHNPKEMIKKINEYADDVYIGKNIKASITNTDNAKYSGYIICAKSDIDKAISEARKQGSNPLKIPFLSDSFYLDSEFRENKKMRIELISYKDLYTLSESRNRPIIDLMYKYKDAE